MEKLKEETGQFYYIDQRHRGFKSHWIVKEGIPDEWIRLHEVENKSYNLAYGRGRFGVLNCRDRGDLVRLATADERVWLQACIDKGKFIHKSEVLPSVDELEIF